MLYREIIAVCSEIHTKHINTLCGQNIELLNVKLVVHIVTTGLLQLTIRRDVTKTVGISVQVGLEMAQHCSNSNCTCYKNIHRKKIEIYTINKKYVVYIYIYIYIYIERERERERELDYTCQSILQK